jgi:hypothetical protein
MVMKDGELFDADLNRLWPDEPGGPGARGGPDAFQRRREAARAPAPPDASARR